MDRKKLFKGTLLLSLFTIVTVVICYYFVDRQTAIWLSQHHFRSIKIFKYLSQIPVPFVAVVPFLYVFIVIKFSLDRWSYLDQRFLTFANGIAITQFLKDFFKAVFGRYWPETWCNNLSLIQDNQYGFNFFHKGEKYGSFPSGHASALLAAMILLWLLYPRLWFVYLLLIVAGVIGILGMNYHFVSDVIAGGVLGYLVAVYTYHINKKST